MKEKLTTRNFVIWAAALIGIALFVLTFFVTAKMYWTDGAHTFKYTFESAVWNARQLFIYKKGPMPGEVFTDEHYLKASEVSLFILPIIGAILILLASVGILVISFVVKKEKLAKVLCIVAGGLAVLGGIFMLFVGETGIRTLVKWLEGNLDKLKEYKEDFREHNGYWKDGALGYIISITAILVGASFIAAPFLPEKKLVK